MAGLAVIAATDLHKAAVADCTFAGRERSILCNASTLVLSGASEGAPRGVCELGVILSPILLFTEDQPHHCAGCAKVISSHPLLTWLGIRRVNMSLS